ncbi:MAG: hypothetical protein ACW987_18750 [Candidatus Thorarchaeota archaeon]|jgi:hypothetical protein
MGKSYVGDISTEIVLDAGVALGTPDVLKIKYQKPDGTTGEWTATPYEVTKARYVTENGDLDVSGLWVFQIYVELAGGSWKGHGEEYEEWLYAPIEV